MDKLIDINGLAEFKYKLMSLIGANGGIAELDENGKINASRLPSYVDDVLEYPERSDFPLTGKNSKIYVAEDTCRTYRWSGSDYIEIGNSLVLGETPFTAFRGDYGTAAYSAAVKNKTNAVVENDKSLVTSGGVYEYLKKEYISREELNEILKDIYEKISNIDKKTG